MPFFGALAKDLAPVEKRLAGIEAHPAINSEMHPEFECVSACNFDGLDRNN